ncbi:hypothetical protein HK102_004803 [Quaeritorhiza haematococci]|nr:hypothetical protein HK102_004803 [Quaeritorhiza haematococci]
MSVVATTGDFECRIDILDLGIILSTAMTQLMATREPGCRNGIATICYTQLISPIIIRNFGKDIGESDNYSGSTDEENKINTDWVYDVFSSRP